MNLTVIGLTEETTSFTKDDLERSKTFSGKNAGICYMKDSYFDSDVSDNDKAFKRFSRVSVTGHHSIADHVRVEVLLENISKMLAIVLNSLQDYATSEKSGRYTTMGGNSEEERQLYCKWKTLFRKRILDLYPDIDDEVLTKEMTKLGHSDIIITNGELNNNSMADFDDVHQNCLMNIKVNCSTLPSIKLAQENARYVLSVFTRSTTMGYSATLRQWNYIYDWCLKYMSQYEEQTYPLDKPDKVLGLVRKSDGETASYFETELYKDFAGLADFIKENLYVEELRDTKDRCFEFLTQLSGDSNHPMTNYHVIEADDYTGRRDDGVVSEDDYLGITYSVSYPASFVHIAQAERHRTLKYFMQFNPSNPNPEYLVPKCIRGTNLEQEWLADLKSVKDLIPQATMVGIIETGHISDFILKCKERLCGRAQLEIMEQTEKTANRFISEADSESSTDVFKSYVGKIRSNSDCAKTKCQMLGGCKETCRWIASQEVFTRLV